MSAAMIASTVESMSRSRNSLVDRSSCSSARSAVTSRNARITAPVPASTVDVETETQTGAPDVVESWRSNESTLTPASTFATVSALAPQDHAERPAAPLDRKYRDAAHAPARQHLGDRRGQRMEQHVIDQHGCERADALGDLRILRDREREALHRIGVGRGDHERVI